MMVLDCSKQFITGFNHNGNNWGSVYEVSDTNVQLRNLLFNGKYMFFVGTYDSAGTQKGHISRGPYSAIIAFPSLDSSTLEVIKLVDLVYPLETGTSTAVSFANDSLTTDSLPGEESSASYNADPSSTITDVSFYLSSFYKTMAPGEVQNYDINVSCSVAGLSAVDNSISQYGTSPMPTTAVLDDISYKLKFTAPHVSSTTNYDFYIKTSVDLTADYFKHVRIKVKVPDPPPDDTSNSTTDPIIISPSSVNVSQTMSQACVGGGLAIGVITNFISSSSPHSMWTLMNQFQMFLMLNLLGAHLHSYIKNYLQGFEFANFDFEFLSFQKLEFIQDFLDEFSCEEDDEDYELIGFDYQCTLLNNFQFFIIISLLIICHIILNYVVKKYGNSKNLMGKILTKLYQLWNYAIYIRLIVEAYLFLYLSSLNEIYTGNVSKDKLIFSFIVSLIVLILLLILLVCIFMISKSASDQYFQVDISKYSELYQGTKATTLGRFFNFVFLLRRTL